jgi:hypothetical protein
MKICVKVFLLLPLPLLPKSDLSERVREKEAINAAAVDAHLICTLASVLIS